MLKEGRQDSETFFSFVKREEIRKGMDLTQGEDRGEGEGQVQASNRQCGYFCLFFFSKVEIAIGNHRMQITKLERE